MQPCVLTRSNYDIQILAICKASFWIWRSKRPEKPVLLCWQRERSKWDNTDQICRRDKTGRRERIWNSATSQNR